jgi:hypothetical protein
MQQAVLSWVSRLSLLLEWPEPQGGSSCFALLLSLYLRSGPCSNFALNKISFHMNSTCRGSVRVSPAIMQVWSHLPEVKDHINMDKGAVFDRDHMDLLMLCLSIPPSLTEVCDQTLTATNTLAPSPSLRA